MISPLIPLTGLAFQGIVLSWIRKLERTCNCSKNWRRDFIKLVAIIGVITNVFVLVGGSPTAIPTPFVPVMGILGLVNIFAVLTYIPDLKKKACVCAIEDDWRDNFIFWWTALAVLFTLFALGALALRR